MKDYIEQLKEKAEDKNFVTIKVGYNTQTEEFFEQIKDETCFKEIVFEGDINEGYLDNFLTHLKNSANIKHIESLVFNTLHIKSNSFATKIAELISMCPNLSNIDLNLVNADFHQDLESKTFPHSSLFEKIFNNATIKHIKIYNIRDYNLVLCREFFKQDKVLPLLESIELSGVFHAVFYKPETLKSLLKGSPNLKIIKCDEIKVWTGSLCPPLRPATIAKSEKAFFDAANNHPQLEVTKINEFQDYIKEGQEKDKFKDLVISDRYNNNNLKTMFD